jgi:hypothetical protein
MKLITKELEEKFKKYPFGSQENLGGNAKVIVKYFNPVGAGIWLITEAEKQEDNSYLLYGYCHLGDDNCAELGYVFLSQLEEIDLPLGLKIERDLYMKEDSTLVEAMRKNFMKVPKYLLEKEINEFEKEEK